MIHSSPSAPQRSRLAQATSLLLPLAIMASLGPIDACASDSLPWTTPPYVPLATRIAQHFGQQIGAPTNASVWHVMSCANDGPGSLRAIIGAATTLSGDIVDLSTLPLTCSTITVDHEITIAQSDLTIRDEGHRLPQIAISGGNVTRVLKHTGTGLLGIDGLTIKDGQVHLPDDAFGGCILSMGSVNLVSSTVTGCVASGNESTHDAPQRPDGGPFIAGGGIQASGHLSLLYSAITHNVATGRYPQGGGASSSGLTMKYSTLSDNYAGPNGSAGGARVYGSANIRNSTISSNKAYYTGGLVFFGGGTWSIANSTISGNSETAIARPHSGAGGISFYFDAQPPATANISETTITGNLSSSTTGGIYLNNSSTTMISSSIIAGNTSGGGNISSDLYGGTYGLAGLTGTKNLILSTLGQPLPAGVQIMPVPPTAKLGQLQNNGGMTMTHCPLAGSPAIGAGTNAVGTTWDQRGKHYPRDSNGTVDVGSCQFDEIFPSGFE